MSLFFKAILLKVGSHKVIRIPLSTSEQLSSRGMVMIQGTVNDITFTAPLEPDGKGSHWFEVSDKLSEEAGAAVGQTVALNIEPLNEWIEPEIPEDILDAINKADLLNQWKSITTKARWEWIRWIRSTNSLETRKKRIEVTCSKLEKGDKRPCCFL